MGAMTEQTLQRQVLRWLKHHHSNAFVWKIADRWRAGLPDLFILEQGRVTFIELKVNAQQPRPLQVVTLQRLRQAGANAVVCWTLADVQRLF